MGMKLHTHPSLQQPHAVANAMGKPVPHSVAAPVTSSMLQKQGVVRVPSNVTKVPNQARPSPSTGLPKFSSNPSVASVSQPVLTIPQAGKLVSTKGVTSAAMMSPEGESPPIVAGHMTYVTPSLPPMAVHTVPYMSHQGLMVTHSYPTPPQPHSTLSKMLLAPSAPTQQQNIRPPKSHVAPVSTFTHSPGQPQPTSKPGTRVLCVGIKFALSRPYTCILVGFSVGGYANPTCICGREIVYPTLNPAYMYGRDLVSPPIYMGGTMKFCAQPHPHVHTHIHMYTPTSMVNCTCIRTTNCRVRFSLLS